MDTIDILIDAAGEVFVVTWEGSLCERIVKDLRPAPPDHPTRKALETGRDVRRLVPDGWETPDMCRVFSESGKMSEIRILCRPIEAPKPE